MRLATSSCGGVGYSGAVSADLGGYMLVLSEEQTSSFAIKIPHTSAEFGLYGTYVSTNRAERVNQLCQVIPLEEDLNFHVRCALKFRS